MLTGRKLANGSLGTGRTGEPHTPKSRIPHQRNVLVSDTPWTPSEPLRPGLEDWEISERFQYLRGDHPRISSTVQRYPDGHEQEGAIIPPSYLLAREAAAASRQATVREICMFVESFGNLKVTSRNIAAAIAQRFTPTEGTNDA